MLSTRRRTRRLIRAQLSSGDWKTTTEILDELPRWCIWLGALGELQLMAEEGQVERKRVGAFYYYQLIDMFGPGTEES